MADDADGPALDPELVDNAEHLVERLGVKRAEAFIDEERLGVDSPGLGLDHVGQPKRERQRGVEGLAARQRFRAAFLPGVPVDHRQRQPGALTP